MTTYLSEPQPRPGDRGGAQPIVRVKLLREGAIPPARMTADAAGYDLYAPYDASDHGALLVSLGVAIEIPQGWVGLIKPRSGSGIQVFSGTLDADYRGEVKVILLLPGMRVIRVKAGQRIAQLVVVPHLAEDIHVVDELSVTERGEGGFGSTGE